MGFQLTINEFDILLSELKETNHIYAPKLLADKGKYSDTDMVTYAEINSFSEIVFDQKTVFSPKEIVFPINQTLFYFTENEYKEPEVDNRNIIIFLRACDINAFRRLDVVFLENGPYKDNYYEKLRTKVKFFLMECTDNLDNCFCVSMNTNRADNYSVFIRREQDNIICHVQDDSLKDIFTRHGKVCVDPVPQFVTENTVTVIIPKHINTEDLFNSKIWDEYTARCIACGRCNVACPTCTCFTMQDIFYTDNQACGERRRVWASCQIDGFTDMAGGHGFRQEKGQRMRFKAMHKIYDFKKRFGFQMCVGCGRCDDVCPEYISFSNCINKVHEISARRDSND